MEQNSSARRLRAFLSPFTLTQIHLRNPWVVAWWSFAFPGFGNLIQGRYIKGFIFILWEIIINTSANINLGILYTLLGRFDDARKATDARFLILYVAIYVYAIWDSYRSTVDINKLYVLADHENATLMPFTIKTLDINYLDKRNPWVATTWSTLMPGVGHLYCHKIVTGFFILAWTLVVMFLSHVPIAINYSLTGNFLAAKSMVNMEWLMYLPSIFCFAFYDAYSSTVEANKLFEKEQSKFLISHYQRPSFTLLADTRK